MKPELSLLDRLGSNQKRTLYSTQVDESALLQSVLANVQNMLNVRLGSVLAPVEYGMPDFNDIIHHFPDSAMRIRNAIREFLDAYEPRLRNVSVQYVEHNDDSLTLCYLITANLVYRDKLSKVRFDTILTGVGQATVRV